LGRVWIKCFFCLIIQTPFLFGFSSPVRAQQVDWDYVNGATFGLPQAINNVCKTPANSKDPGFLQELNTEKSSLDRDSATLIFSLVFGEALENIDKTRGAYILSRLCVDKVIDNGLEVTQGYPLWKNRTSCTHKTRLEPYNFQVISALLGAGIARGVELGCINSGSIQLRDIDFDFFILKNSEILRINIQNVVIGSLDLHNTKIAPQSEERPFNGTLNIQGSTITKRLTISRTDMAEFRVFASFINDVQIYDFYQSSSKEISADNRTNDIGTLDITHSEVNNIRLGVSTRFERLFIVYLSAKNLYLASIISEFAQISESNITNSLVISSTPSHPIWSANGYLDLSSTRVGSFYASEDSFKLSGENNLVPVNFSGFSFGSAGNFIPNIVSNAPQTVNISDISVSSLMNWLAQSAVFFQTFRGVDIKSQFPYRLASIIEENGNVSRANSLRIAAKSVEWWGRSYLGWIVGNMTGFGYATHRLLWVLMALVFVGWVVKVKNGFESQRYERKTIGDSATHIAEDLIFSMDRLFPPLAIQQQWDHYPDLTEGGRIYFYFHRIAGSLTLVLGAFSLARAF